MLSFILGSLQVCPLLLSCLHSVQLRRWKELKQGHSLMGTHLLGRKGKQVCMGRGRGVLQLGLMQGHSQKWKGGGGGGGGYRIPF